MAKGWRLSLFQKVDRFLQKITITDTCWEWQGFVSLGGYGRYKWHDRNWIAHRLMWQLFIGDLPDSKVKVCHTCDNRKCMRPSHLFLGSQQDNIADMVMKGRQRTGMGNGEKNRNAKLTINQVLEIRRLRKDGMTQEALGQMFGVYHTAIGMILRGKTWKHVEESV